MLVGLVLGVASVRTRRLELASARHAGVRADALALQTGIETTGWVLAGTLLATPVVYLAASTGLEGVDTQSLWVLGLRTVAAGAGACIVGAVLTTLGTRERHLFRYFKQR